MNPLSLIPSWVYAAAIAVLLAAVGTQTVRLSGAQTDVANLQKAASDARAERLTLIAAHNLKVGKMQTDHAKTQQEIIGGFIDQKLRLQAEHTLALDRAQRVRGAAAAAAARDRDDARGDPAACQRVADNNAALYDLVSEGFSLVEEGGGLLGQAANEINTLRALSGNDRALLDRGSK